MLSERSRVWLLFQLELMTSSSRGRKKLQTLLGFPSARSSAFLRRFIAERGFPFEVKAFEETIPAQHYDISALEAAVKRATLNPDYPVPPDHLTYFDPKTQRPVTVYNRKEP